MRQITTVYDCLLKIQRCRPIDKTSGHTGNVAEEYSDGILHVTTRQDFQPHFVHIDDTLDLMRRLGPVGITTREACGNVVRNVTAGPLAGVCGTESFDVTPYAEATATFLLGHPDAQGNDRAQRNNDRAESRMTRDQIAEAQRMSREWLEAHPPAATSPPIDIGRGED